MLRLEGRRIILRPFSIADSAALSAYRSDPEVARYQGWESPFTEEQAREFITAMQGVTPGTPGAWYQLAIERKDDGTIAGDCAFRVRHDDHRQAEIGVTLDQSQQGRGFASEALTLLLGHLFVTLRLHRVIAITDCANDSSVRLLERIGMRREGTFIENIRFKGAWGDEYLYALLDREWLTNNPPEVA